MNDIQKWIWQHPHYPNFSFDREVLSTSLSKVARINGKLEGILTLVGDKNIDFFETEASIEEIVASSKIEGEVLNRDSVRSSILKRVGKEEGKDSSTKHTDGLVEMFLDSSTNHSPMSIERLHGWHNTLFPTGYSGLYKIKVASFRQEEMSVVSYKGNREIVHYIAVPAKEINRQIDSFLDYINHTKEDPYIKASIAHFWFVTIHPYDDGNGRIARALANFVLSKELKAMHHYYSISTAIAKDKKRYYELLEKSQNLFYNRLYDLTDWVLWHTDMINSAIAESLKQVQIVVDKAIFWERAREFVLNERQLKVLNRLLEVGKDGFEGGLSTKKYRAIAKTSIATAKRDIADLLDKKLLMQVKGTQGRNVKYELLLY